jgi:hypothetical protein
MRAFGGRPGRGGGVVLRMSGMWAASKEGEGGEVVVGAGVAVTLLVVLSAKDDLDIEAESFARGNFVWGVTIVGMDVDRGVSISRVSSSSYLDP